MKKIVILLSLVVVIVGCVSSKNWTRRDGQPMDAVALERDVHECNRGWTTALVVDVFLSMGIASLIHYLEASHCMTLAGYARMPEVQIEAGTKEVEAKGIEIDKEKIELTPYQKNLPPWQRDRLLEMKKVMERK